MSTTTTCSTNVSSYESCKKLVNGVGKSSYVSVPCEVLKQFLQDFELVKRQSIKRKQKIQVLKEELEVAKNYGTEVNSHYMEEQRLYQEALCAYDQVNVELNYVRQELQQVSEEAEGLQEMVDKNSVELNDLRANVEETSNQLYATETELEYVKSQYAIEKEETKILKQHLDDFEKMLVVTEAGWNANNQEAIEAITSVETEIAQLLGSVSAGISFKEEEENPRRSKRLRVCRNPKLV